MKLYVPRLLGCKYPSGLQRAQEVKQGGDLVGKFSCVVPDCRWAGKKVWTMRKDCMMLRKCMSHGWPYYTSSELFSSDQHLPVAHGSVWMHSISSISPEPLLTVQCSRKALYHSSKEHREVESVFNSTLKWALLNDHQFKLTKLIEL